jgi:hypothetical protein
MDNGKYNVEDREDGTTGNAERSELADEYSRLLREFMEQLNRHATEAALAHDKIDTPVEYIIISLHFLTSSMNTSAPKPCMARAPELVKWNLVVRGSWFVVVVFYVPTTVL